MGRAGERNTYGRKLPSQGQDVKTQTGGFEAKWFRK